MPLEAYEASALFQMKFYALVIWRLRGVIPRVLQLMYLSGDGEVLRYSPDEADLRATERKLEALWAAISRARETGDWRPRPSRLCDWCRHKALCPEFGGTLPPLPERARRARSAVAARGAIARSRVQPRAPAVGIARSCGPQRTPLSRGGRTPAALAVYRGHAGNSFDMLEISLMILIS